MKLPLSLAIICLNIAVWAMWAEVADLRAALAQCRGQLIDPES